MCTELLHKNGLASESWVQIIKNSELNILYKYCRDKIFSNNTEFSFFYIVAAVSMTQWSFLHMRINLKIEIVLENT